MLCDSQHNLITFGIPLNFNSKETKSIIWSHQHVLGNISLVTIVILEDLIHLIGTKEIKITQLQFLED